MESDLRTWLSGKLGRSFITIPGSFALSNIIKHDKNTNIHEDLEGYGWRIDVLDDGTAITYYGWVD